MIEEAEQAYRKALFILERRDHTQAELQKKLQEKEFSQESIALAMERLKEYGFIDDRRFTEQYLRYHSVNRSKRVLSMKLLQKGICTELFDSVYGEMKEEFGTDPELEALKKAVETMLRKAERKGYSVENLPRDEKNRMMAALYRKGFAVTRIQAELDKAVESY